LVGSERIMGISIIAYGKNSLDLRPSWVTTSPRERIEFVSQGSTVQVEEKWEANGPVHEGSGTGTVCKDGQNPLLHFRHAASAALGRTIFPVPGASQSLLPPVPASGFRGKSGKMEVKAVFCCCCWLLNEIGTWFHLFNLCKYKVMVLNILLKWPDRLGWDVNVCLCQEWEGSWSDV
jgi:hypothetical protein